jgi:hypothetical protein
LWRPVVEKWIPARLKPARGESEPEGFASLKLGVIRPLVDVEARARLSSVREVCEHERQALENLRDPRLNGVLEAIARLHAEIIATLVTLGPPPQDGR